MPAAGARRMERMIVKVQKGRYYRDGSGDKRGPMQPSNSPVYPWRCTTSENTYTNDGVFNLGNPGSPLNLIAEWEEEPTTEAATWLPWRSYRAAPKLLRDMTDAEFGALLLAQHRGKVIEGCKPGSKSLSEWAACTPQWFPNWAYRIRPETVTLYSADALAWSSNPPVEKARWRLSLTVIDGEPSDPKLEALE